MFSTDDHCREFVSQKGLVPLMGILGLPNLPVDFPIQPACQVITPTRLHTYALHAQLVTLVRDRAHTHTHTHKRKAFAFAILAASWNYFIGFKYLLKITPYVKCFYSVILSSTPITVNFLLLTIFTINIPVMDEQRKVEKSFCN